MLKGVGFVSLVIAAFSCGQLPAQAQSEQTIAVPTRPGQHVRALLMRPAASPHGSVILLAGGHGNLALAADGALGWGKGNQLVRTRAAYARAGFLTLVPDIAPDLKQGNGGVPRYRWSAPHAQDLGFLIAHLRKIAPPVHLIGTSRAALSVANAAVRLSGSQRPDTIVITSGMLMHISDTQPSAQRNVGRLERIAQPTFIVFHENDGCAFTPASSGVRFKRLLTGSPRVDVKILTGGSAGTGDPCQARSHHGFLGQDDEVVASVSAWLKALPKR